MIGIAFVCAFALLLVIQVKSMDAIEELRKTQKEVDEAVGHATACFPDAEDPPQPYGRF